MSDLLYLKNRLSELAINNSKSSMGYRFVGFKRFFVVNLLAFFFEYLSIISIPDVSFPFALYPAIGVAFIMCYLLGNQVAAGLLLGNFLAYFFKGYSHESITVLLLADVGIASMSAYLCRNIFASDIPSLATVHEWMKFIGVNALLCVFSTCLRLTLGWPQQEYFYYFVRCWFADLNSIIVIFAFLSAWMSIYLSREKIATKSLNKLLVSLFIILSVTSILWAKSVISIYIIIFLMGFAVWLALLYGYMIATALMYVVSMIYTAHFIMHLTSNAGAVILPISLFLFIMVMISVGLFEQRRFLTTMI